jgi:fluoride exporter
MWQRFLMVMLGGSLGAASRFIVSLLMARWVGLDFAWGTLAVNLAGCFMIGVLFAITERALMPSPNLRLFLITGYLGALTSYSAFALASVSAVSAGMISRALVYILTSTVGCISMTLLGIRLASRKAHAPGPVDRGV